MAQVLAPMVQTPTMLQPSNDGYSPTTQAQRPRPAYNAAPSGAGYRGTSAPIATYAFSSTPQLRQEQARQDARPEPARAAKPGHLPQTSSSSDSTVSTTGSSRSSVPLDAAEPKERPASAITLSTSVPDLSLVSLDAPARPSPDRYRRGVRRTDSSATVTPASPAPGASSDVEPGHHRSSSADDSQLPRGGDTAKRYRRRSLGGFDVPKPEATAPADRLAADRPAADRPAADRPASAGRPASGSGHERNGSTGSASSSRPASRHEPRKTTTMLPTPPPPRGSSDPARRAASPLAKPSSPLAKPMSPDDEPSPAVQQLTALTDAKEPKGVKSRLRRAFSFGSAAELRKASAEHHLSERARLRKEPASDARDAEHDAIVAKQEAAGIGAGIYSGQGGFAGSTDNLSISSTASSASVMLRKMGTGVKKGTRSIKGLFRPKSVIGVPAADTAVAPSAAQVSMVTVEAEREKVNVHASPAEQAGGGTGYPKLERNSVDARDERRALASGASSGAAADARRTIVGGERERAEVLSAMKKGILKRAGTSSDAPSSRPADDTPKSSAPSTPADERPVLPLHGDDYFAARVARSLPHSPRNITFSPRIQLHDAWSSSDYDRRGDIATCNRLTPLLAQQIKEELNSFKMEMEVHELSKPHTHFF